MQKKKEKMNWTTQPKEKSNQKIVRRDLLYYFMGHTDYFTCIGRFFDRFFFELRPEKRDYEFGNI